MDKAFENKEFGTLLLQLVQKTTKRYLGTNKMIVWIEVRPLNENGISSFYKKIGFKITSPTKQNIQHFVPESILSIINNMESYDHLMEIHDPIKKQTTLTQAINKFTKGMCDMCYNSPCAILCDKIVKESHIEIENTGKKKKNKKICVTKLCISCQTSFGLN